MAADRDYFLATVSNTFPDVLSRVSQYESGLLHCEVAVFRRATEDAMDNGRAWLAEQHFRLVEQLLRDAGSELRNALEVSYLEDLALGECTPARHAIVKERMPQRLRDLLIRQHEQWR